MSKNDHVEKGPGLARGPALIMGAILSAAGLLLFLKAGNTPTGTFPDGMQNGKKLLGFEANGWTAWFTTLAGVLLLFGAAQHLLAKTMSLLVGLALGACSIIAIVDHDDVLGLAAANGPVKLAWGVAAAILLINSLMPRVRRKDKDRVADEPVVERTAPRRVEAEPVVAPRRTETVDTHPVDARPVPGTQRVTHDDRVVDPGVRGERDLGEGSVDPRSTDPRQTGR